MAKWNIPNEDEVKNAFRKVRDCEVQAENWKVKAIYAMSELVAVVSAELHDHLSDGGKIRGCKASKLHKTYLNIFCELNSISKDLGYGVSWASDFEDPSLCEEDDEE